MTDQRDAMISLEDIYTRLAKIESILLESDLAPKKSRMVLVNELCELADRLANVRLDNRFELRDRLCDAKKLLGMGDEDFAMLLGAKVSALRDWMIGSSPDIYLSSVIYVRLAWILRERANELKPAKKARRPSAK